MDKDEIIEIAMNSGLPSKEAAQHQLWWLEAFAKLVADVATAKEREACAKACENVYTGEEACGDWPTPEMCATAVRARGQQ